MRRVLAIAWALAVTAAVSTAQHGGQSGLPPAKNVLVIVLDDVGTDKLSFYGETPPTPQHLPCVVVPPTHIPPYASTPRLDELRRGGIWFTNAYANPVCSPTRACILTGRYAFRTGIGMITNAGTSKLPDSEVLIPELLRDGFVNGPIEVSGLPYKCGAFGKWHLTHLVGNASHAVDNGFHRFYGSISNVAALDEDYFDWTKVEDNADGLPPAFPSSTTWHGTVTRSDAANWINAQTKAFFAYVCFNPPHAPFQVPPQHLVSTATWNEIVCWGGSEGAVADDTDPVQLRRLYYRAMLEAIDKEIDNLLDEIEPKLANTMVFVIGDNGTPGPIIESPPHTSGHGKGTVYEWGVRVPLIVSGPLVDTPVPADGWRCDVPVGAVDLWSTIAAITGADPDDAAPGVAIDGVSFLPVILDPANDPGTRQYAFSQYFSPNGVPPSPPSQNACFGVHNRSLSDGRYKYIRKQVPKDPVDCDPPEYTQEFYRIVDDREETFDFLANTSWTPGAWAAYQAMTAEMDVVSQP